MEILIIVLLILGLKYLPVLIKRHLSSQSNKNTAMNEPEIPEEPTNNIDYSQGYQRKFLLTKNEWQEYKKLKLYAEAKQFQVCPKVRLLDIVEPRRGVEHYKSLFYKIQAKHVDFVICDQNLYIKAIVELDDNSHNQTNRKERDEFVDQVLTSVGYKVIRTRAITEETLKDVN